MATNTNQEPQKIKIMILKTFTSNLSHIEKYFAKRDFDLFVSADLKTFIMKALSFQPDFVILPLDHPISTVQQLPKILPQVLKAHIIPYASQSTTAAIIALKNSGSPYAIHPPVTGPKLERTINKFLSDLKNPAKQMQTIQRKDGSYGSSDGQHDMMIKIGGGNSDSGKITIADKTKLILDSLLGTSSNPDLAYVGNKNDETGLSSSNLISSEPTTSFQDFEDSLKNQMNTKGQGSSVNSGSLTDSNYIPSSVSKAPSHAPNSENGRMPPAASSSEYNEGLKTKETNAETSGPKGNVFDAKLDPNHQLVPKLAKDSVNDSTSLNNSNSQNNPVGPALNALNNNTTPQNQENGSSNVTPMGSKNSNPEIGNPNRPFDLNKKNNNGRDDQSMDPEAKGALAAGFKQSLKLFEDNSQFKGQKYLIDRNHPALCLMIESEKFKGYAIIVSANMSHQQESFTKLLKKKLKDYFESLGEDVDMNTLANLTYKTIPFEPWALDQAEILEKSFYEGEEIAMAFFPTTDLHPKIEKSQVAGMIALHMDELRGNIETEFDIHLRLPLNQKLVRYTPKGSKFLQEQRDRLILSGVTEMYLKKDDQKFIYRYRVQNFLNDKVDAYLERIKKKKKTA